MSEPIFRRDDLTRPRGLGLWPLMRSLWVHRVLTLELARRETRDLHAGQSGGLVWALAHPVLMFLVYAFLFTAVLKVRIGDNGPADYTLYLFSGLMPWLFTQDVMTRSAPVMIANQGIVKKVMFPVELLVAKTVLASIQIYSVLFALVVVAVVAVRGEIPWTLALLPLLIGAHLALCCGLALLLGAITPYFRDTTEFLRIFLSINLFLLPVMYLPEMVPSAMRFVVVLNPFSALIWCYQDVLYFGRIAHPGAWIALAVIAALTLVAGSLVFSRLKSHISSVI